METSDLISFNCTSLISSSTTNAPVVNSSPGNNPFDDLTKNLNGSIVITSFDTTNPIVQINDLNEDLIDFLSGDFGRESLILGRNSLLPSDLDVKSNITDLTENTDLNVAFLNPKLSTSSTVSGFNTKSLNGTEISKIYSISSNGMQDEAFANSLQFVKQFHSNETPFSPERNRIHSLPTKLNNYIKKKDVNYNGAVTFDDNYNILDDSVFIEAKFLASRIENLSTFDQSIHSYDSLDNTAPPIEMFDKSEAELLVGCNTENVYKTIDKLLPIGIKNDSKSPKDAKEILQSLSEIFSNENLSDQQAIEGQQLLCSLANILRNSNSNLQNKNNDDSGHSSINELISKQTKSTLDLPSNQPLDLSLKKRLSQSFNLPAPKVLSKLNDSQRKSSSLDSTHKSDCTRNILKTIDFKPKKVQEPKKKGPVKAVVPINEITKKNTTPKRIIQVFKSKKTSTPINESKLKPVAQSTPDGPFNKLINKKCFVSPLNSSLPKLNTSIQKPSLAVTYNRSSTSDLRGSVQNELPARSNSTGRDPKMMSVLNRVRDNLKLTRKTDGGKIGTVRKSNKENAGHYNY